MAYLLDITKHYLLKKGKVPSLATMDYLEARRMRANLPKMQQNVADLAAIQTTKIPMRDGHEIAIRIYTPNGEGPFPIIVYYHGGGWVLNDLETCHESCSHIAKETNHIVVSVAYRLAPEFKFPVPVYDAFDSFVWVSENAQTFNGDIQNISVGGDSAGGNLAIAVCQLAHVDEKVLPITAQLLLYPVTDLSYSSNSYHEFKTGFGLDRDVMKWFGNYYIANDNDATNPLVAPVQLKDFSYLPPALIIAAENDVLRDEAILYGEKLKAANVKTELVVIPGVVHSFFTNNDVFHKEVDEVIQKIHTFLNV
ncbi:alpha/beta hydrolase fold domain-containing protein [Solibacillus sp. FSL R7-0682]|uniref:alpha/beta hydrolase n=1 Tax=Solibacillus sp. FSL R7-0682 TaxID=2921690 RepID=UPI0030F63BBF